MSQAKYKKLITELHTGLIEAAQEMQEMGVDVGMDELASEVASTTIIDEAWITPLLSEKGVTDFAGRLADDIYSGRA